MSTNNSPIVYIIVLTWNGKKDTLECLSSLQRVSYPNTHIILVDNASTDRTIEAVRRDFPHAHCIRNERNLRYSGGNNVGMQYALTQGADYVLLLNNDTVVDPPFLDHLIQTAESSELVGIVGPMIYYHNSPKKIWFAGGIIRWWQGWIEHRGIRETNNGQYSTTEQTDYVTGCCLLVKRSVIEKIGFLDERYFMYGEDVDYCVRASRAGFKIFFEPNARIWHKISVSSGGHFSWFKNWNKLKSLFRLIFRYSSVFQKAVFPFGFFVNVIRLTFRFKSTN